MSDYASSIHQILAVVKSRCLAGSLALSTLQKSQTKPVLRHSEQHLKVYNRLRKSSSSLEYLPKFPPNLRRYFIGQQWPVLIGSTMEQSVSSELYYWTDPYTG